MQFLIVAVFLAIATVTNGSIISSGQCTNAKVQSNFQVERYLGSWYEIHRYENVDQLNGECVKVMYTPRADESIDVLNSMVFFGTNISVEGNAIVAPNANGTGKLLVNFPFAGDKLYDYWVLTTDYTSYSVVYACENISNNTKSIATWILSRKSTLSPQAVLAIDPFIKPEDGLFWQNYRETFQSEAVCKITD